jgi:hypothetical protein
MGDKGTIMTFKKRLVKVTYRDGSIKFLKLSSEEIAEISKTEQIFIIG